MTEYEYEYYSVSQNWPNTNTNIIRLPRNDQIPLLFGFPIMTEYKYYLASQKWSNSINEYKFCWGSQKEGLQDQFWVSQGDAKFAESSDDWSQLQMQTASYPYDSPDVTLVHEDELQFWRTKYFWQHRVLKEEHSPTHFSEDWLIQSSEKWQIFMCPLIKSINAQQNMYSIQKKFPAVFGLRKSPENEYE